MIQIVKDTRPWFFLQTTHSTYGINAIDKMSYCSKD